MRENFYNLCFQGLGHKFTGSYVRIFSLHDVSKLIHYQTVPVYG